MKKKFAGILAVLMVLVMGTTTAFAADSPTAEEIYKDAIKSASIKSDAGLSGSDDGKIVIASVNDTISKQAKAAVNKQKEKGEIIAMADVSGENITKGTLTLTLPDDTLKKSDQGNVYVLHQLPDGSWEKLIPTEVGSNYVTVDLNSFSPICVVVGDVPVNSGSGNNNGSSGGSYPVYYPVYYPSSGSNSNGSNSTTQPGNSNTPSDGNSSGSGNNGSYEDGYSSGYGDGYEAGRDDAKEEFGDNSDSDNSNGDNSGSDNSNEDNSGSGANASGGTNSSTVQLSSGDVVTAPKTGASLPALPFVAVFAAAGIALCGKKARKSDE